MNLNTNTLVVAIFIELNILISFARIPLYEFLYLKTWHIFLLYKLYLEFNFSQEHAIVFSREILHIYFVFLPVCIIILRLLLMYFYYHIHFYWQLFFKSWFLNFKPILDNLLNSSILVVFFSLRILFENYFILKYREFRLPFQYLVFKNTYLALLFWLYVQI